MPFWRSWGAALLGASGVALLVPVGLLLVVAVSAGVSGTTGVGKLGQVAAGPALPSGGGLSARDGARLPTVPRVRATSPGGTRVDAAPASPAQAGRTPAAREPSRGSASTPGRGTGPGAAGSGPVATGSGPAATGTGTGTPPVAPATPSGLPAAVVVGVQRTIAPVPVVGPIAADAVGSVAGLILPPGSLPPRAP